MNLRLGLNKNMKGKSKKHSLLLKTSNLELRTFQNLHLATGGRECSFYIKSKLT